MIWNRVGNARRVGSGAPPPVEAFKDHGTDFVVRDDLRALVEGMNALTDEPLLSYEQVEHEVVTRDREVDNPFAKDLQVVAVRGARRYLADRLTRVAAPHRLLDPKAGPLIAVRLRVLTRKTLGGLHTDLDARVLRPDGAPLPGLYAAGEVYSNVSGAHPAQPPRGGHAVAPHAVQRGVVSRPSPRRV